MTSFKLVKYIPRVKKKKSGLRKLARKVPTDRLLKFEQGFKAQKRINMSVFKAQRVLDEIRWRYNKCVRERDEWPPFIGEEEATPRRRALAPRGDASPFSWW
jgi:large subunit ribosomal protein L22